MGLVSQRQVAKTYLTEIAETMLVEACTVVQPGTVAADGAGGFSVGAAVEVETTCQRLASLSDAEREVAGRLAIVRPMVLVLPVATVIDEGDEVAIGAERFVVRAVAKGSWSVRVRVLCSQTVTPVVGEDP